MPMLRITVTQKGAQVHGATDAVYPALKRGLCDDHGPVTVLIHGYKYLPGHPVHCPHGSIFSRAPRSRDPKILSWPKHLGLQGQSGEGLCVSFGWTARGTIWEAHQQAERAGMVLAGVLAEIRRLAPRRPVHVVAHSLGARVALAAIRDSVPGAISRAILLAAAEYGDAARAALLSAAGRRTEVLNVTSRENDLFDFMMERLVPPRRRGDRMLGHGCTQLPNMVTLQLDDKRSLAALSGAGFEIAAPERLVCHWSPYLREGVFPLYKAYLDGAMPLAHLRALLPDRPAPRWSRLVPRLPGRVPQVLPAE